MKRIISLICVLIMSFSFMVPAIAVLPDKTSEYALDHVLVSIKKEYSGVNHGYSYKNFDYELVKSIEPIMYLDEVNSKNELLKTNEFHDIVQINLKNASNTNVETIIKQLQQNDIVESVNKDYEITGSATSFTTPNDPYYSSSSPNYQYSLRKLDAKRAWSITKGSTNIKVGVMDSGIYTHNDLSSHYDASVSHNFTNDAHSLHDMVGHGTHVAGIIGAITNNETGIAGTAWNVTLVSLKVLKYSSTRSAGTGLYSWFISAIQYAANNNIPIINASLGGENYSQTFYNAVNNYNGLIVAAAGNNGNTSVDYPAAFDLDNIISVANSTSADILSNSSSYDSESVDLAAPGDCIISTMRDGSYDVMSGTSMATPHVTGVAALIASMNSSFTPLQIKNFILKSVDKKTALNDKVKTKGRLNAFKAVCAAGGYKMGDVDFDGEVTVSDARLVARYVNGLETLTKKQRVLADIDKSNSITIEDSNLILEMALA